MSRLRTKGEKNIDLLGKTFFPNIPNIHNTEFPPEGRDATG